MGYKVSKNKFNSFISNALESGYHDEDVAIDDLKDLIEYYNKLPDILKLYRLVFLKSKKDLNRLELGSHYVIDKNILINSHYDKMLYDYNKYDEATPYIITVEVSKSKIDFDETINNNLAYPNEAEITLKNKGKGSKIIELIKFIR